MRYFREVDVAKVCYAYEAVEWIVLGRVPEFVSDDAGSEIRGNYIAFLNEFRLEADPLTEAEFKSFGGTMKYGAYLDALYGLGFNHEIALPSPLTSEGISDWQNQYHAAAEKEKEKRKLLLDEELAGFEHEVARAKIQVMAAILQGKIKLHGYWAETEEAFHIGAEATELENAIIPPALISPNNFNWEDHTLSINARLPNGRSGGAFFLVTMDTEEMLRVFDPPTGQQHTFRVVNGNALLEAASTTNEPLSTRPRGRPPKSTWLRDGMRDWYQEQCRAGLLGKGKLEADLAAAAAWAKASGHDIARSSVQTYLRDLIKGSGSQ